MVATESPVDRSMDLDAMGLELIAGSCLAGSPWL